MIPLLELALLLQAMFNSPWNMFQILMHISKVFVQETTLETPGSGSSGRSTSSVGSMRTTPSHPADVVQVSIKYIINTTQWMKLNFQNNYIYFNAFYVNLQGTNKYLRNRVIDRKV